MNHFLYRKPSYLTPIDSNKIDTAVFHHTGNDNDIHINTDYHMDSNGWNWLGYGAYIANGIPLIVRGCNYMNAGVEGHNDHTVNIAIQGNYNKNFVSEEDIKAGQECLDYFVKLCPNLKYLKVHSYFGKTSCAGKNFPIERFKINREEENKYVTFEEFEKMHNMFNDGLKKLDNKIEKMKEFLQEELNIRIR